jgi:dTDP-4-amino-4,6-dideoxygalactose transaminase
MSSGGRVLLNDFKRQWAEVNADVMDAVRRTGESGWYILGTEVAAFERELASYWGRRFCVGVANGLDAIEIGLRAMHCKPGDKVLMSPISAFATALAAVKIGAVPVFVDSDAGGLVDLDLVAETLNNDSSIRVFVPVHLFGQPLDMSALASLRDRFGVHILEDCAQSIGASFDGKATGTAGECAATSFYPTKNLGAFGDGGALLTDSEETATAARQFRDYGQSAKYKHSVIGYNSRLDELHAAILRSALLPRLNAWTESRRRVAAAYLKGIRNPLLTLPVLPSEAKSCWHLFPVLVPAGRKQEFMQHLADKGISSGEHYPSVLADQPALREVAFEERVLCSQARDFCSREVSLPIHPQLTDDEIGTVIEACNYWR